MAETIQKRERFFFSFYSPSLGSRYGKATYDPFHQKQRALTRPDYDRAASIYDHIYINIYIYI